MPDQEERFREIVNVEEPCTQTGKTNTFEYWFNYLWKEARVWTDQRASADTSVHSGPRADICRVFETVFQADAESGRFLKDGGHYRLNRSLNNVAKLYALNTLLKIGFAQVQDPCQVGRFAGGRLFAQAMQYKGSGQILIGFRADQRPYGTIMRQQGFVARARAHDVQLRQDYGLDQPWNPFNFRRNEMFLRRGTQDNCLFTVVSVGTTSDDLVHFPILGTLLDNLTGLSTRYGKWNDAEIQRARGIGVRVEQHGSTIDHLEHDTHLYVVRCDNLTGFNTQEAQGDNKFGEVAVTGVPLENLLAEMLITRYYCCRQGRLVMYDFKVKRKRLLEGAVPMGSNFRIQLRALIDGLAGGGLKDEYLARGAKSAVFECEHKKGCDKCEATLPKREVQRKRPPLMPDLFTPKAGR